MDGGEGSTRAGRLEVCEVDGVATFVVATATTPWVSLTFRTGQADETLATRGWTHLVEHLVLHGRRRADLEVNGSVGLLTTEFVARGEQQGLVAFLETVCRALGDPAFEHLDHELAVLRAEELRRGVGALSAHLGLRYGPHGPGLAANRELGVVAADPAALTQWARTVFTRGNAVLAASFVLPDEAILPLSPGPRRPPPALPRAFTGGRSWAVDPTSSGVTASGLVTVGRLSSLLEEVVRESVFHRLRETEQASYGTNAVLERVDAQHALLGLQADVLPERMGAVVAMVNQTVGRLADSGPTVEILELCRTRLLRQLEDDPFRLWQAQESSVAHLYGEGLVTHDETVGLVRTVGAGDLGDALKQLSETLVVTVPTSISVTTALRHTTGVPDVGDRSTGAVLRHQVPGVASTLRVDGQILELTVDNVYHGIRLHDAAALLRYRDGARVVVGEAGDQILVEPQMWERGTVVVTLLDEVIPAHVWVEMAARPTEQIGVVPGGRDRALLRARTPHGRRAIVAVGAAALSVLVLVLTTLLAPAGSTTPILALLLAAANVVLWRLLTLGHFVRW